MIETCAMSSERARDAMAAKLPALETLELWFGSQQEAADATLDDLRPLFEGAFPKVTRLALRNQEFGIDLVEALAASKLAKQLVTLDLSMSTLDDDAADDFVDLAKQFPALTELNVDDNFLTAAGLDRLRGAVKTVTSSNQSKLEYAEENERFASIRE